MQRAIMEGERETGVTVMYMDEGLDTGDILLSERFPIGPTDDFETVHDRSAMLGGRLLSEAIKALEEGRAPRIPQDNSHATYAAKIEKADCKIDFTKPATELDCIIRGVTPIPGAFAYLNDKMLKINRATPIKGNGKCGEVIDASDKGEGYFTVACGEGALKVTSVIPEGKGRMGAGDFVRGRKISVGDVLE
jgi:methionyl-tRNA formyltransferase